MSELGVFGAGVAGILTCLELQDRLRNSNVTLVADKFTQDTTSDGAAGIFLPATYFSGPNEKITDEWLGNSYTYYKKLIDEPNIGIKEISGYCVSSKSLQATRNHLLEKIIPFRQLEEDELCEISPGDWKFGSYYTTLLIECRLFLPWAMKRFLSNGGTITQGKLNSFEDVSKFGKFDCIVNCTGLGAGQLCNDKKVVPIRGQVFKVDAPWLKNFYYSDSDTYVIPGFSGATLGGTRNFGSTNTEVDKNDSRGIWERCTRLVPRLATAPVLREWVGLRPYRPVVRVQPEIINGLKIVHNYGHGGYGITSSPGTAITAVDHVQDLLGSSSAKY